MIDTIKLHRSIINNMIVVDVFDIRTSSSIKYTFLVFFCDFILPLLCLKADRKMTDLMTWFSPSKEFNEVHWTHLQYSFFQRMNIDDASRVHQILMIKAKIYDAHLLFLSWPTSNIGGLLSHSSPVSVTPAPSSSCILRAFRFLKGLREKKFAWRKSRKIPNVVVEMRGRTSVAGV